MSTKSRTTIALSDEAYRYLKSRVATHGALCEYLDRMLIAEKRQGPVADKIADQTAKLERLVAALETLAHA